MKSTTAATEMSIRDPMGNGTAPMDDFNRNSKRGKRTPVYMNFVSEGVLTMDDSAKKISKMSVLSMKDEDIINKKMFKSNLIYSIIIWICIAMIVSGICMEAWYIYDVNKTASSLKEISDAYVSTVAVAPEEDGGETQQPSGDFDELLYPPIVDFEGLQGVNPDVSAWLRIPGTSVDYPVLSPSWQDQYLNTDLYGNYSISGSIFSDFENSSDLDEDSHIIIYGHHMIAPIMFHDVSYYDDYDFFMSHRTAYLETPETTYRLKAIGCYIADPSEYMVRQAQFGNEEDFQQYLDGRLARCDLIYEEDFNRATTDRFVTLVTCTATGAARLVVEFAVEETYPTSKIPHVLSHAASESQSD